MLPKPQLQTLKKISHIGLNKNLQEITNSYEQLSLKQLGHLKENLTLGFYRMWEQMFI